ncbi:MAG: hypothetical protein KDI37_02365 [Xanthomonadales bacterium]|nr:hypothetical protein [Xanthomonadales bacterium]
MGCSGALYQPTQPVNPARIESSVRSVPLDDGYWVWRVSYPTGRFHSRWLLESVAEHDRMTARMPAGTSLAADGRGATTGLLDPSRATELGPRPLDSSTSVQRSYGNVSGRTNVLLTHPTDPSIAWLGSDGGGVWKTTNCCDSATQWSPKTDRPELASIAIGAMALDPADPNVLYAGTGDHRRNRSFTFGAGGLLKSVDGGENWALLGAEVFNPVYTQPIGDFPQYRAISTIAIDPRDSARLIVGTNHGLYLSADAGQTWTGPCLSNSFVDQRQDVTGLIAQDIGGATRLIVAIGAIGRESGVRPNLTENGANGIYAAQLGAGVACPSSWQLLSTGGPWPEGAGSGIPYHQPGGNSLRRLDLAVAPSDPQTIYVQRQQAGVYRSQDGGISWEQRSSMPADFSTGCVGSAYGSGINFQDYNAGLIVSPTDPNVVFLSSTDLWRSADGGASFHNLTCGYDQLAPNVPGYVHVDQHARAYVNGDPQRLLIGHDGGVSYTANAMAAQPDFQNLNDSLATIEFYSGALSPGFNDPDVASRFIVGGAQDNGGATAAWLSGDTPGIATWQKRMGSDVTHVQIEPILGQRIYYSIVWAGIFVAIGGYDQSATTSASVGWLDDRIGFLAPFRLYTNGGEDSCPASTGCQRMLVGTHRVWEHLSGGIPNTDWYINSPDLTKALLNDYDLEVINALEFVPSDPDMAYVGTNDGNFWRGHGLGSGIPNTAVWVDLTGNNQTLPNRPIMDVAPHPLDPDSALVGLAGFDQNTPSTPGHVYRVECLPGCQSISWSNRSGNLPNIPVNALLINPNRPEQVYAGTDWGLYFTDDINQTPVQWHRFEGQLPNVMIWDLVHDHGATSLGIFTRSRGAWVFPLAGPDLLHVDGFESVP